MSQKELVKIAEGLQTLEDRKKYNKQEFMWPATGPFSRDKYIKHLIFMKAGKAYRERALIAANRVGKTHLSMSEASYHLNGKYPDWWEGKTFNEPISCWAAGKTHETTRDILQAYLLGPRYDLGSGMIPKCDIIKCTTKPGVPEAIQDVYVRHYTNGVEDGISELSFKSYIQGKEAFMGTAQHLILLDEEPGQPGIYSECITRTMTTGGIVICTFTPLDGMSDTVMSFIPDGVFPPGGIGEVK